MAVAEKPVRKAIEKGVVFAIKVREKVLHTIDDIRPKIIVEKSLDELRAEARAGRGRYFFLT